MSQTFNLICPETKKAVWIGQGHGLEMTTLYSGDKAVMENLKRFLNDHKDQAIIFICTDEDTISLDEYDEYEDEVDKMPVCSRDHLDPACPCAEIGHDLVDEAGKPPEAEDKDNHGGNIYREGT